MKVREPLGTHREDYPWNDAPGDSCGISGTEDPAPAEVVGEDGYEHDLTTGPDRGFEDWYHHDTLSERLAEEEPESRLSRPRDREAELRAPRRRAGDVPTD